MSVQGEDQIRLSGVSLEKLIINKTLVGAADGMLASASHPIRLIHPRETRISSYNPWEDRLKCGS